jgi:hypothetical protein
MSSTPRMPPLWQGDGSYASARAAIERKPGLDPSVLSPRLPLITADAKRRKPPGPQAGTVEFYQELATVSARTRHLGAGTDAHPQQPTAVIERRRRLTGQEVEALRLEQNRQRLRDRKERALDITKFAIEREAARASEARARAVERRMERHGAATRLQAARRGQATRHQVEVRRRERAAVALQARMRGARTRTEVAAHAPELHAEMRARALDIIARNNAELSLYFAAVEERLERADIGDTGDGEGGGAQLATYAQAVAVLPSWDDEDSFALGRARPVGGLQDDWSGRDEANAHAAAAAKLQGAARGSAVRRSRRTANAEASSSRDPVPPAQNAASLEPKARPRPRREVLEGPPPDKAVDPVGHAMWEIRRAMAARMQRVTDVFKSLDLDGNNRVTQSEFRQALPLLQLPSFYGLAEMDALVRRSHPALAPTALTPRRVPYTHSFPRQHSACVRCVPCAGMLIRVSFLLCGARKV